MTAVATRRKQLESVRRDASGCRRCDLYWNATQTVFGEGRAGAPLMLIGEQPGDVEDEEGRPFVGPAGRLLRALLAEAGLEEPEIHLTNSVKLQVAPAGEAPDPQQAELVGDLRM